MNSAHVEEDGDIPQDLRRAYQLALVTGFFYGLTGMGWAIICVLSIA